MLPLKYLLLKVPFFILFIPIILSAQNYSRFRADFTIKSKFSSGQQQLTMGQVYFDKDLKQIFHELNFPEKENWLQKDTLLYKIVNAKVVEKTSIPDLLQFTIYYLALNGNLSDYGLKKTRFSVKLVEKEGKNVISTWEAPKELRKKIGDIVMMNTDGVLTGIIFKNPKGEIVSRQFFRNYVKVGGIRFPKEIIKEILIDGKKNYEITTYDKIVLNDYKTKNKYDYKLPK